MRRISFLALVVLAGLLRADSAPEKYLLEGKLAEGEKALLRQLEARPGDDESRFGLGVIQFFQGVERLGKSLHKHGLKTQSNFAVPPALREFIPENPNPEKMTHAKAREIVAAWVSDLNRAGATLDGIKNDQVKLPLHVGRISVDVFGAGKPVNAAILLGALNPGDGAQKKAEAFLIAFDRADAYWLRGYLHFLAALGEFALAVDTREVFECVGHRFFSTVESPHAFLQQEDSDIKGLNLDLNSFPLIIDAITFVHLNLRWTVTEPERMKKVLEQLQGMVANAKKMWPAILAEADDDHEWIPGPKQTGVIGVKVTKEMVESWLMTLEEVDLILQGKAMLPFWRGKDREIGVNLRAAMMTPPREVDLVRWIQGTAATPYLHKGSVTKLANPATLRRLDQVFGGLSFFGFAFWFN